MATKRNSPSSDGKNNQKNNKPEAVSPITREKIRRNISDPEMIGILYGAAVSNRDVEIRFEKDGTLKVYIVSKKRIGTSSDRPSGEDVDANKAG